MVLGQWSRPQEGEEVVFAVDDVRRWKRIVADADGWLIDENVRGGYVYVSMEVPQEEVIILEGMGHRMAYVNGEPRAGNLYQYKEQFESWEPRFDYSHLPILLRQGSNDLMFQGGRVPRLKIRIHPCRAKVMINERDVTMPDLIVGQIIDHWAAVVLINATTKPVRDIWVVASLEHGDEVSQKVPELQPLAVRKVPIKLTGKAPALPGKVSLELAVVGERDGETAVLDKCSLLLETRQSHENHKRTFVSDIDGSVQYYALNPAQNPDSSWAPALFLSVHGAAVEAINQSAAYKAKTWGHIVSPTNRRPYGFNWEDWGRIDALEVLEIAIKDLGVDPSRVYLTGHSMGGHGTWHLGALYPDRFAALGPSAGWISFWSYRPSRKIEAATPVEQMLMRSTAPSRTFDLIENYRGLGVYVLHGKDDDNVPAEESRSMVSRLETFHNDFVYHEEPEAGHWWDKLDEEGADCVDWYPMFDFFARHSRAGNERVRFLDFRTPNPGVSAWSHWVCIEAQTRQLQMSTVAVRFDPGRRRFVGRTENVERLTFDLSHIDRTWNPITFELDGHKVGPVDYPLQTQRVTLHRIQERWVDAAAAPAASKGPHRYGTFKDVFNHRVVFVFGTKGSQEENAWAYAKARYDAETFWYQGNGSIDVVRDVDFDPLADRDRNVVLYGNEKTNSAWKTLLGDKPVRVKPNEIRIGSKKITGRDLGVLMIRPRPGSDVACVGVVSGTGVIGMRLTDRRPYMSPGFAYPDLVVFYGAGSEDQIVCGAGFFGLDWGVESGEFVWDGRRVR